MERVFKVFHIRKPPRLEFSQPRSGLRIKTNCVISSSSDDSRVETFDNNAETILRNARGSNNQPTGQSLLCYRHHYESFPQRPLFCAVVNKHIPRFQKCCRNRVSAYSRSLPRIELFSLSSNRDRVWRPACHRRRGWLVAARSSMR